MTAVLFGAAIFLPKSLWPSWAAPAQQRLASYRLFFRKQITVGPEGDFRAIGDALRVARRGQTVEVEPGEYSEHIVLKSGVDLVSRVPRGAILRLMSEGTAEEAEAIRASETLDASLRGFHILGIPGAGVTVGLRLIGSELEIEDLEIEGTTGAGIAISGPDRSVLRYSYLHDNAGTGISIGGSATTKVLDSVFERNGASGEAALDLLAGSNALVIGNQFSENSIHVQLRAAERQNQIRLSNRFSGELSDAIRLMDSETSSSTGAESNG